MDTNLFMEKVQMLQTNASVMFVSEIDREIEIGGNWCKHRTSGGYIKTAIFDGKNVQIRQAEIVESDENQYHIGCSDSASVHQVKNGSFLVTCIIYQSGAKKVFLTGVYVTPEADLDQVIKIIKTGPNANWKK